MARIVLFSTNRIAWNRWGNFGVKILLQTLLVQWHAWIRMTSLQERTILVQISGHCFLFSFIHTSPLFSRLICDKWKDFFLLSAVQYCLLLYCRSLATLLEPGSFMNKNLTMMMMMRLSQILSLSKVIFYVFVSFIPYFHLLVFGILVTLVAWFSFRVFLSCPSCLEKCKQRLKFIYSEKATKFCEIFTLLLTGTT